ncbi:MAG: OmpA family protein [Kangiellaceae bacterium]|nr:OmpA family protein [Kangiellaceae bacterium]
MSRAFLIILLASALSFSIHADEEVTGPYVALGQNYFIFDSDKDIENDHDFYFGIGYQTSNRWGFEVNYTEINTQTDLGPDLDVEFWSVSGIYRYQPRGQASMFWNVGVGEYESRLNTVDSAAFRIGLGYDFANSDSYSWVVGTDVLMNTEDSEIDLVPYVGLQYFFGTPKKKAAAASPTPPPAPQVKDSDGDGVADQLDRCPNTAAGVQVDSNGCELDSDNDGVVNSKDKCLNTPAGAKVDQDGCRVILQEDVSIKLNVQFANNSDVVSDDYRNEIAKVANFMRQYPDTNVVIEGHTDSRGAANYNQQLSQKRADAVRIYLINNFSIDASRVTSEGKGEATPIASNDTAEGRATNRRVQAEIKTTVSKPQ